MVSSSERHMFVSTYKLNTNLGFIAYIHFGKYHFQLYCRKSTKQVNSFSVNCSTVSNGDIGFCACKSCTENEGDCDGHHQCQDGLTCGSNISPDSSGFDSTFSCYHAQNIGDENFCTSDNPCKIDEGDCDSNEECQSTLFCGSSNCPDSLGVSPSVDCCESRGTKA